MTNEMQFFSFTEALVIFFSLNGNILLIVIQQLIA